MLATARPKVSLAEVGIERVKIRKAMTGGIIREVPWDKERDKTPALAGRGTSPGPGHGKSRGSNKNVGAGIDISVGSEELWETLAGAR